jgi:hypothetical protein
LRRVYQREVHSIERQATSQLVVAIGYLDDRDSRGLSPFENVYSKTNVTGLVEDDDEPGRATVGFSEECSLLYPDLAEVGASQLQYDSCLWPIGGDEGGVEVTRPQRYRRVGAARRDQDE